MTCFFIVILTKQGKLLDAYVNARSISEALDKFIAQYDLAGNIAEFKFCIVRKHY
jgi:hypothetical protein